MLKSTIKYRRHHHHHHHHQPTPLPPPTHPPNKTCHFQSENSLRQNVAEPRVASFLSFFLVKFHNSCFACSLALFYSCFLASRFITLPLIINNSHQTGRAGPSRQDRPDNKVLSLCRYLPTLPAYLPTCLPTFLPGTYLSACWFVQNVSNIEVQGFYYIETPSMPTTTTETGLDIILRID